jgi:hypothetical protein
VGDPIDDILSQRGAAQTRRQREDDGFATATDELRRLTQSAIDRFLRSLHAAPSAIGRVRLIVRQPTPQPQPARRWRRTLVPPTPPETETAVGWLFLALPWAEVHERMKYDTSEYSYSASALVVCEDRTLRVGVDTAPPEVTTSRRFSTLPGPMPTATTLWEQGIRDPVDLLDSWAFNQQRIQEELSSGYVGFTTGSNGHTLARRAQFEVLIGSLDNRLRELGVEWASAE